MYGYELKRKLRPDSYELIGSHGEKDITTPGDIAEEMVNLIPDEEFNMSTTFLCAFTKSANFAISIYNKLINCKEMRETYPILGGKENRKADQLNLYKRREHIFTKQLFVVMWSRDSYDLLYDPDDPTKKNTYRDSINRLYDVASTDDYPDYKLVVLDRKDKQIADKLKTREGISNLLKGNFGKMNFDIVIANPPYDRTDIQMKFGLACFDICTKYNVMIIPAKWQCKGDKTKEKLYSTFRKEVVPHMSKICYFLQCAEVFDIHEPSGISYYIADKQQEFKFKTIENRCGLNKFYNDMREREFTVEGIGYTPEDDNFNYWCKHSLNNRGQQIIDKLGTFKPYLVSKYTEDKQYQFWCGALLSNSGVLSVDGTNMVINCGELNTKQQVEQGLQHDNYNPLFTSDSMLEVASFLSYAYTKFVRFLIFNSICGLGATGQDPWWRFVPDPVAFDHLFTDEELYKKYNLTPDEIAIIDGTIAERPFSTVWSWIPKEYQELALKEKAELEQNSNSSNNT